MTDPRLNRRRGRDHLENARWHMKVWREWKQEPQPSGWPRESSEVRASESRQAQTNLRGKAAYRGYVTVAGRKERKERKEAPPMPKETRPSGHSRIPPITRARLGPKVDRLLLDLEQEGGETWARLLRMEYEATTGSQEARAETLELSKGKYKAMLREGLAWLSGRLGWIPLEKVQAGREVELSDERS